MSIESYRDLEVWQRAMDLAEQCYTVTKTFPREELLGMTSQIRRSAASIPANIAEGQGREHTREFIHFLRVAMGSLKELETHLLLCERVGLLPPDRLPPLMDLAERVSRMLTKLCQALERRG